MEAEFIAWAKRRVAALPQPFLGIGDDAAVLEFPCANAGDSTHLAKIVVTADSLGDGSHFKLSEHTPQRIGRKSAAVNLSDIAAMGAKPVSLLVALTLPRGPSAQNLARDLFEGICEMAERFQVSIAGGDTNCWDGPLTISITAIGQTQGDEIWRRDGAKAGDLIVVTGPLGGSILGKHLDFIPRLDLAKQLGGRSLIHAATDVSDGLALDLHHIASSSRCGAIIELDKIPISDAAVSLSGQTGKTALQHALGDGEDFELLFAVPKSNLSKLFDLGLADTLHVIGEFTSRTGLWSKKGDKLQQLPPHGYSHS